MNTSAKMQYLCDLPNGDHLYYADPAVFEGSVYKVWVVKEGEHIDVSIEDISLYPGSEKEQVGVES